MTFRILTAALLLSACQGSTDSVPDGPDPESATATAPLVEPGAPENATPDQVSDTPDEAGGGVASDGEAGDAVPADAATLGELFRARHVEDVPSAADLSRYATAEASLQWLASNDGTAVVRVRALAALRAFPTDETSAFLRSVVLDENRHPAQVAAAIIGLSGRDLNTDSASASVVVGALRADDERVTNASVDALSRSDVGRAALESAVLDSTLPAGVRAAAAAAIE